MNADKINGWASVFRLVTPILLGIVLWILSNLAADVKEVKSFNLNHLEHHRVLEVNLARDISAIKTNLGIK